MGNQSSFEIFLRTGRRAIAPAEPVEAKFNQHHDPRNGRFTFAPGGAARAVLKRELVNEFKKYMIPIEGDRNAVYLDHLGNPTVGIGHLIVPADRLNPGDRISDARKAALWQRDSAAALGAAQRQMKEAGITDANFLFSLASVNFQLGIGWNKEFKKTWASIKEGNYNDAAREVQDSLWYEQSPPHAKNFQSALRALPTKRAPAKR